MLHFWIIVAADKQLAAWQPTRSPGNSTNALYTPPSLLLCPAPCPVLICLIAIPFTAVKQNVRDKLKSELGTAAVEAGVESRGLAPAGSQGPGHAHLHANLQLASSGHQTRKFWRAHADITTTQEKDEHGMTTTTTTTTMMMTTSFAWMKRPNEMPLIWQMNAVACLPCLVDCLTWQRRAARQLQYSDDNDVPSSAFPLGSNYPTSVSKFHFRCQSTLPPCLPPLSLNTRYTHNNRDVNHLKFSRESAVWLAAARKAGVNQTAAKV